MLEKIHELEEEARVLSESMGLMEREVRKEEEIMTVRSRDGISG